MKILCVVPSYKPAYIYGGPVRSIASLCEALVRSGQEVTVFTTTANGKAELNVDAGKEYNVEGVRVFYYKRQTKDHSNFSFGLLKTLRQYAPDFDIIHIHSWWNFIAVISAFISLKAGKVPVISPRGTMTAYSFSYRNKIIKRTFHQWIGEKLLGKSVLHVTSEEEKGKLREFVRSNNQLYVIPNLLELPDPISRENADTPFLKLIFVGRIHPVKNLEMLFEVLKPKTPFPYQLIIVGEGEEPYVQNLKSTVAHLANIQWLGNKDGDEKFEFLANADLLVLPSHIENFGNVVIESLSQGTPVLVSEQVGIKDYILENNIGWVVPLDPQQWINTLNTIWKDRSEWPEKRARAIQCIKRDFHKEEMVQPYLTMYEETQSLNLV